MKFPGESNELVPDALRRVVWDLPIWNRDLGDFLSFCWRTLIAFLRHFPFEFKSFYYFRYGVSGGGEGAGVVVEGRSAPEVGAPYQDFRSRGNDVVEGVVSALF